MSEPCRFLRPADCSGAVSVVVASTVTNIAARQFQSSSLLQSISFETESQCTAINDYSFASTTNLKTFECPASLLTIGQYCFSSCSQLESITFNSALTNIGAYAFATCRRLTSIGWPATGSITINQRVFLNVEMTTFHVANSIASMAGPLTNSGLTSFTCVSDHPSLCVRNGVLFTNDNTTLVAYPPRMVGDYTVPSSVKVIGKYAFDSGICTAVVFEDDTLIQQFDQNSFYYWNGLTVTYPDHCGLTTISQYAFSSAPNLQEIKIIRSLTSFSKNSFPYSGLHRFVVAPDVTSYFEENGVLMRNEFTISMVPHNWTEYTVPARIKSISNNAFAYSSMRYVSFERDSELASLGQSVFAFSNLIDVDFDLNCPLETFPQWTFQGTSLDSITIPLNLESIDGRAFAGCSATLIVPEGHQYLTFQDDILYSKDFTQIILYPSSKQDVEYTFHPATKKSNVYCFYQNRYLERVNFPPGSPFTEFIGYTFASAPQINIDFTHAKFLTTIGNSCFSSNTEMTSIVLPDSVTTIGTSAFSGATRLSRIKLSECLATINTKAFEGCLSLEFVEINPYCLLKAIPSLCFSKTRIANLQLPWRLTSVSKDAFADTIVSLTFHSKPRDTVLSGFAEQTNLQFLYVPCECSNWNYTIALSSRPEIIVTCSSTRLNFYFRKLPFIVMFLFLDL